jgi:hypothetical protein
MNAIANPNPASASATTGANSTIGPNKAIASGLGGAVVTIVVWAATLIWQHLTIPPEVAAALTTVVGTALVWFVPHRFGSD